MRAIALSLAVMGSVLVGAQTSPLSPEQRAQFHGPYSEAVEPFRIVGNIYYVGAKNIASYLLTTPQGHILIDTGTREMGPVIRTNVEKLGFKLKDIKILLSGHAHFDHVQGHAAMKQATGARVMAIGDDAAALASGTDRSPLGDEGWEPVKVDRVLKDGDTVTLGGTTLRAVWAPGHTPGCTVWTTRVQQAGTPYSVAFYACGGPNAGVKLVGNARFPHLVDETVGSFDRLKQLKPDIYLTMHPQNLFAGKVERIKAGEIPHPLYDPDGWTKMIAAAEANFLKRVKEEQTPSAASGQTDASREAIFAALQRGADSEVERLLASGVSPDVVDEEGTPALMVATLFGSAETVALLLKHGADPNRADASGATALMWAVPDAEKVRLLLARGASVNARSESERTALLVAAAFPGTSDVLRLLLAGGADIRAQDRSGATALAFAVRSADVEVVRFLVEKGLDPNALSAGAQRAALARYDRPTTDYLVSKGLRPIPDLLVTAASWQPADLVGRWIELGANVNATNAAQYGRTPLLTAVASERAGADTLKLLLDRGADPNVRTTEGESPLDWAMYKGDRAKITVLEQHGATRGNGPRQEEIPPPAKGGIADPRVSLNRSVARLLDVAPSFRQKATCISCHHNALPAIAAGTVRRKGIEVDEVRARKNFDDLLTFFKSAAPRMMLGDPAVGGEALTVGYAQRGLAAEGQPLDKVTATMTHWVLARQMPDGSWLGNGLNRPPSEYSTISHTAMAVGGLISYPLPGRKNQIAESLRRSRQWLLAAQPASAEERGMRLMGLVWTDAPRSSIEDAIRDIRAQQDARGGWSQFARTEPDAYATGLSLFALHVAGVPVTDEAYRKGVSFLLGSQYQDGTWLVKTHSFPVQRYFESGFPFGRHQWISAAGTAWAALAIAQTLPDVKAR